MKCLHQSLPQVQFFGSEEVQNWCKSCRISINKYLQMVENTGCYDANSGLKNHYLFIYIINHSEPSPATCLHPVCRYSIIHLISGVKTWLH